MKNLIIFLLLLLVLGEVATLYVIKKPDNEKLVLLGSVSITPSPLPLIMPSAEPLPTPTPEIDLITPKPTPKQKVTPVPNAAPNVVYTSQEINNFIERFSSQYSVNPDVLRHVAICESDFNPSAQNLGYAGLYQFNNVTWKNLRTEMGEDPNPDLRFNAEEAVQTAAYVISVGKIGIWPNCSS